MGRYGRAMAELMTAGMDAEHSRQQRVIAGTLEEAALNGAGVELCAALPGHVLLRGDEGLPGPADWWRNESAVRACFPSAPESQLGRLQELLADDQDPKVLDALRVLRSLGSPLEGQRNVPACGPRVASLHRALHGLASFYHASPFFARGVEATRPGGWPEACSMGGSSSSSPCGLGAGTLCATVQGHADRDALGAGQLSWTTKGLLSTGRLRELLASRAGEGAADGAEEGGDASAQLNLDAALARGLATNKQRVCETVQWASVERDEDGNLASCPDFCHRDMRVPWLTSADPGRSQCGVAWAMFSDHDSLGTILTD
jgi:hypothetical protein